MHSFCWRGVGGIKNRSERNGSTSPGGVTPLFWLPLFFSPQLVLQSSRPVVQKEFFFLFFCLWQALSHCPHPTLDTSLTGCWKYGSLLTVLLNSVDGVAGGFAGSTFLCKSLLRKPIESSPQLKGPVSFSFFLGSVHIRVFVYVGVCHFSRKTFTAQPYDTFPPVRVMKFWGGACIHLNVN